MEKKWLIKSQPDTTVLEQLRSELKVDNVIANLLLQRNIRNFQEAENFFRPKLEDLHDPFLMDGMEMAVNRLISAIENKENILIFGDYDVDGTTSVSMMYLFLKEIHPQIAYYIPDRYQEGYGISIQGIDFAKEKDCKLIICLDCGIRSIEKIAYAKEKGIDFIVCDHHEPGTTLPECITLDPKKKTCNYPFKELSGCGVGFKFLQAFCIKKPEFGSTLLEYLDFVTVSIGADLVQVRGENRILAHFGIKQMNENLRPVFKHLLEIAQRPLPITLTDVVFVIAPRINAAGRIRSGMFAVDMMVSDDTSEIELLAEEINADNTERRKIDSEITKEALEMISLNSEHITKKSTVVYKENWHKGVIGIVASRLIESHYKPTIVFTKQGEYYTGSARTVNNFDIHSALTRCEEWIDQFGGHTHAAGLTIHEQKFANFLLKFEETVKETICADDEIPQQEMDYLLRFKDLFQESENRLKLPRLKRILDQFEPYGPGNMKPLFLSENVYSTDIRILKENHLKMTVVQHDCDVQIEAIGFNLAEKADLVAAGLPFDMIYTLESNTWKDRTTLQLNIKDLRSTI